MVSETPPRMSPLGGADLEFPLFMPDLSEADWFHRLPTPLGGPTFSFQGFHMQGNGLAGEGHTVKSGMDVTELSGIHTPRRAASATQDAIEPPSGLHTSRMAFGTMGDAHPSSYGLRTPKRAANTTDCNAPSTPPRQRPCRTPCGSPTATPEARKCISCTPPSAPVKRQSRLEDDLDAAMAEESLPSLVLALTCGHSARCCRHDHTIVEAVHRHRLEALRFLLESGQFDVDERCRGGRALHYALNSCVAEEDSGYKMAEMLLEHGARPDACPEDEFISPLEDATRRNCLAAVKLLVRFNVDPNVRLGSDGCSAIHMWARALAWNGCKQDTQVLDCLLAHGASPFLEDANGFGPIDTVRNERAKQELIHAQRWWSTCKAKQVCRLTQEHDGYMANAVPWAVPEILEAIVGFVCS